MDGLTVKGIKTWKGHEGEPLAQAMVYLDGKKVAFYSDSDNGAAPRIEVLNPVLYAQIEGYCQTQPPRVYETFSFPVDPEMLFGDLIDVELRRQQLDKQVRKAMKKATLFVTTATPAGEWQEIPETRSVLVANALRQKNPDQTYIFAHEDFDAFIHHIIGKVL